MATWTTQRKSKRENPNPPNFFVCCDTEHFFTLRFMRLGLVERAIRYSLRRCGKLVHKQEPFDTPNPTRTAICSRANSQAFSISVRERGRRLTRREAKRSRREEAEEEEEKIREEDLSLVLMFSLALSLGTKNSTVSLTLQLQHLGTPFDPRSEAEAVSSSSSESDQPITIEVLFPLGENRSGSHRFWLHNPRADLSRAKIVLNSLVDHDVQVS